MSLNTMAQVPISGKEGDRTLLKIFHFFPDPVFIITPQGVILDANQAFADQFNKKPEEFFGLNVFDFLPPEVGAERLKMLQKAVSTSKALTFDDKNNGRHLRSTIYPYTSPEGIVDLLLIFAQDITDIELLLTKEQLFNKQIINAIPGTFYVVDADGKFLVWNDQLRHSGIGKTDEEMAETYAGESIHPEDRAKVLEQMKEIINNDTELIDEFRVLRNGGSAIEWRLMTGKRITIDGSPCVIGVGIDITERKIADEALQKSEKRFRTLFNSQSAIQALLDPDTGKVLDVNQKAVDWYGWSAEELKQMYAGDINSLSPEAVIQSLQTVEAKHHNKFIGRHRRADGSIRDVEIYRNEIELDGKAVIHVITHDITERREAEEELERKNRALLLKDYSNHALLHAQDEDALLQDICNIIVEAGGYRIAWVGYANDNHGKRIRPIAQAGFEEGHLETLRISWADDQYGNGPAGFAIRTGKPYIFLNIHENPELDLWQHEAVKRGYASILSLPLSVEDKVIGALTVYSELPDAFNGAEKTQLISIAENLAFGIRMLRKRKALTQSEERFRNLFEHNAAIKMLIDPDTGNIVDANKAAADFYGWSIDEFRQMNLAQVNTITTLDVIKSNMTKVRIEGHAKLSLRHNKKDGSLHDVEVLSTIINDGQRDLIHAIVYDVTNQKRYEEVNAFRLRILQMAESHSIEELLTATLDEAELLTESSIGFFHFVESDQNALSLQAWSTNTTENMCKAEGKGQHYPMDMAGVWADAVRIKKATIHNDYPSLEHRKGMPEGHAEVTRVIGIPVNRGGKIVAIMGVGNKRSKYGDKDVEWLELIASHVWDIVAKKMAEEENRKLATQLQHASKMEMIGQLAAGIAHEINNPLNFITINEHNQLNDFNDLQELVGEYREIIKKVDAIPAISEEILRLREKERELDIDSLLENIPKTLEMTRHGVDRITAITRSMRNYSFKNEKGGLTLNDINKAVNESLLIAKSECRDVASVALHLDEVPPVMCDPSQISQVILNLIVNSAHAIKSQNRSSHGSIMIKTWATDESVFCSVSDDGPGIAEEVRSRIFEPFFTTKDIGEGTGLGLSISYDIMVNRHLGSISAECRPEGGTVFTVSVPLNKSAG